MKIKYTGLLCILLSVGLLIGSCKKDNKTFDNPYAGGKPALGIVTDPQQVPVPASGGAGTIVSINATGLLPYKDILTFLFNGQQAVVKEVTATGIKVEVPANASTGITAFVVNGQVVFGPTFTVIGKVNIDPTFVAASGANGGVFRAYPIPLTTDLIIFGDFTNYDNKGSVRRTNRIVRVDANGAWDRTFQSGNGANSTIRTLAKVGPYYYIGGDFSSYAQQSGLGRITRLLTTGAIDTIPVTTYNNAIKYVPSFNGGLTGGSVNDIYTVSSNQMIVSGQFSFYISKRYNQPTSRNYLDSVITDTVEVHQLVKLNDNGSLDKTWRFDQAAAGYRGQPGRGFTGANGSLYTIMHSDGKILCYGSFTKFDEVAANRITRLNADGTKDASFVVGEGADDVISYISYNASLNKYLVVGRFRTFGGKATKNIVMLNYDGSVDPTFSTKVIDGGDVGYCKLLNDGIAVVSGSFKTYDAVVRNGFAVIDKTGSLIAGYNTSGNINGNIFDIYETKSADNKRALLIMGAFSIFDNKPVNNIVRVTFE